MVIKTPEERKQDQQFLLLACAYSLIQMIWCVFILPRVPNDYDMVIFMGLSAVVGVTSTLIYSIPSHRELPICVWVSFGCFGVGALGMLFIGIDGAIVIIMAAPFAAIPAAFGALLGYFVQDLYRGRPNLLYLSLFCILLVLALEAERVAGINAPLLMVKSSVTKHASKEAFWNHVISFSELTCCSRSAGVAPSRI